MYIITFIDMSIFFTVSISNTVTCTGLLIYSCFINVLNFTFQCISIHS